MLLKMKLVELKKIYESQKRSMKSMNIYIRTKRGSTFWARPVEPIRRTSEAQRASAGHDDHQWPKFRCDLEKRYFR